jgi:Na+-transporting NADH:ubiquinone oxidoreductase subunit NqrF
MKPPAHLLKILATASLPRDAVAFHTFNLVKAMKNRLSPKPFEIDTQVLSWNEHCFYVRHTFRMVADRDHPIATAYATVSFPSEAATPAALVRLATAEDAIPPLLNDAMRANYGMCPLPTSLASMRH